MLNPGDYGLPFSQWYPGQEKAAEFVMSGREHQVLVLESPPGTGKSCHPALASRFYPVTVLVSSRDLQQQYGDSFPWFAIVWGKDNYPCVNPGRIERFRSTYNVSPTCGDCSFEDGEDCPYWESCPYECAKSRARNSEGVVLNYHYAFWTNWWRHTTQILFLDEAHLAPKELASLLELEIGYHRLRKFGLPLPPPIEGIGREQHAVACGYLTRLSTAIEAINVEDELSRKRLALLTRRVRSLLEQLSESAPEEWYISSGAEQGTIKICPVLPRRFSRAIFPEGVRRIVLMSATIGDPVVLAGELGLEGWELRAMSLEHPFPRERRPVLFLRRAPAMSFNSKEADYKYQASLIAGVVKNHTGQKGIIHTASWSHSRKLASALGQMLPDWRVFIADGERVEAVEKFRRSGVNTVAISPSWRSGLNFPDGQARFCVIAKIPFLPFNDPVVKARVLLPGGRAWYDWQACIEVVQAAGRIVRHPQDWGVTYIADANWRRVSRMAPRWFQWEEI